MYDNYDDEYDSLMAEVDNLLYNEEDERIVISHRWIWLKMADK